VQGFGPQIRRDRYASIAVPFVIAVAAAMSVSFAPPPGSLILIAVAAIGIAVGVYRIIESHEPAPIPDCWVPILRGAGILRVYFKKGNWSRSKSFLYAPLGSVNQLSEQELFEIMNWLQRQETVRFVLCAVAAVLVLSLNLAGPLPPLVRTTITCGLFLLAHFAPKWFCPKPVRQLMERTELS
jgi:hypothetical protein